MNDFLFKEFESISKKAWKQKIQVDLKGVDYNKTLLWESPEGIIVKPFYTKEDRKFQPTKTSKKNFQICQTLFIDSEKITNTLAIDALNRGATSIQFVANSPFNSEDVLKNIDLKNTILYFKLHFLSPSFLAEITTQINPKNTYFQIDVIGNLAENGNWFTNLKTDFSQLKSITETTKNCISISGDLYQNAGANSVQQLAYSLAHANEYLNYFGANITSEIHFNFSVGGNYFFEIAKLKAFRILWKALLKEYKIENFEPHLFVQPSLRNKTLYDYNVNMLRTTTECMSGILGGGDTISNVSYDQMYRKSNEFGERISRNQLLILKEESGFETAKNATDGTYYIESITHQLAEKSLAIFKQIEKGGGFLKQLKEGNIQRKILESAQKEQTAFDQKEITLLGTNIHINSSDKMQHDLELFPFVKQRNIKTLIVPITRKRLAENVEKNRLTSEKKNANE